MRQPARFAALTIACFSLSACGEGFWNNVLKDECCCWDTKNNTFSQRSRDQCEDKNDYGRFVCATPDQCNKTGSLHGPDRSFGERFVHTDRTFAPALLRARFEGYELRQAEAPLFQLAAAQLSNSPESTCANECASQGGACLRLTLKNTSDLTPKLRTAREFLTGTESIEMPKLQKLFGVETDPCERSSINLASTSLSNTGLKCTISSEVANGGGAVEVRVPERLSGVRTVSEGNVALSFDEPSEAPAVFFSSSSLESSYGGQVQRVATTSQSAIIETATGCIALRLN